MHAACTFGVISRPCPSAFRVGRERIQVRRMRFGGLALGMVVWTAGCAKQHGEQGSVPANQGDVRDGFKGDAGPFMVPAEAGWPLLEGGWPFPFPALPDA